MPIQNTPCVSFREERQRSTAIKISKSIASSLRLDLPHDSIKKNCMDGSNRCRHDVQEHYPIMSAQLNFLVAIPHTYHMFRVTKRIPRSANKANTGR